LIGHDLSISVIGKDGGPFQKGLIQFRNALQLDLSLDGRARHAGLGGNDFIGHRVVAIGQFRDANLPMSAILVRNIHRAANIASSAAVDCLDVFGGHGVEFQFTKTLPSLFHGHGKHCALGLDATRRDCGGGWRCHGGGGGGGGDV
jgi:hypothetical protein